MGEKTGISWTDSTYNPWMGCTKVGPGCDNCYAVGVTARSGVVWGPGAPRKRTVEHTRNALRRYEKGAAKFLAKHGHRQRVFCSSLADVFDNEVDAAWRAEAFAEMEAAPNVLIQICTKRVSNIVKMVPAHWLTGNWPRNVGILITTVTPAEIERDVPRLRLLKLDFEVPWVGLSIEPMICAVGYALEQALAEGPAAAQVDWAIFGGESGNGARDCHVAWIIEGVQICDAFGVKPFVKQLGVKARMAGGTQYLDLVDRAGKDTAEWPIGHSAYLQRFEFPEALS